MKHQTILVVDDEGPVRSALRAVLERQGWRVLEAADEAQMNAVISAEPVDLVTLDLCLGDAGGLHVARTLRHQINIPVVIISGKGEPFDRVRGLEAGADDYIVKPFDSREVAIRIGRILDRYTLAPASRVTVSFDHSQADLDRGLIVYDDGRTEDLTSLEARLLELFLYHPAQILSRDQISRALFGRDWSPLDRSIDGHVARLRRKIEPDRNAPTLIRSVRGVGYVFTADSDAPVVGS